MGLIIIFGWAVVYYYLLPFYIRFNFKYPCGPPDAEFFDLEKEELTGELGDFFRTSRVHLQRLGFSPLAAVVQRHTPRVQTYVSYFYNPQTLERAAATALFMTFEGKTWLSQTTINFYSPYEKGPTVITNNSPLMEGFSSPDTVKRRFPGVIRSRDIYLIHQYLTESPDPSALRPLREKGEVLERLRTAPALHWEGLIQRGLARRTPDGLSYRYSLKGVARSFWVKKFPFPQIYRFRQRREALRILRESPLRNQWPEDPTLPLEIFIHRPVKANVPLAEWFAPVFTFMGFFAAVWYFVRHDLDAIVLLCICVLGSFTIGLLKKK